MLKNYFVIATRNILRNKTISFINIFGLSVSMSVCLLLILIVADQYAYDEFHEKESQIHRVITHRMEEKQYKWETATTPFLLKEELNEHTAIENVTLISRGLSGVAKWKEQEIPFRGYYSDQDFFSIFSYPLAAGNVETVLKDANSIVITTELAEKIFGDKSPLNEVIELENVGEMVVTGVIDELPGKTHLKFDAIASFKFYQQLKEADTTDNGFYKDWTNIYNSYTYFTLKKGANPEDIEAHLNQATKKHYEEVSNFDYTFYVQHLDNITPGPLLSNMTGFSLPLIAVYMMLGVAAIVLLAAAFNYANLTTARAMNRAKEIGVRKVMGARKGHIFGQFMIESLIIALIAFIFADLIVQFIVPQMNSYFESLGAPMQFEPTPYLYLWFLGFVVVAGLFAGVVPSLFFSSTNPLQALKKSVRLEQLGKRFGFAKINVRKALLVMQFAFSIFFVITVLALYQQLNFVLTTDHGFKSDKIVTIDLQGVPYDKVSYKYDQLASVSNVSSVSHMPALGINYSSLVTQNGEDAGHISYMAVAGNFIESMGLQLLAGRNFPDNMPDEEKYIIINERAVVQYGFESKADAVGQQLRLDGVDYQIIGVMKDFHYERLDEEIGPFAFRYNPKRADQLVLKTNNANTKAMIAEFEAIWKDVTNRPFNYAFYEDDLKLSYGHFEALLMISGYVSIIIVSIACLGFLGMVIYHVQNRTKEIGVRKTLGASALDILKVVGKQFAILITIAFLIGGPLAWFVNNMWLETNTYRFDFGWVTILTGCGILLVVLLVTIGSQLYKAIKINPTESLRNE